MPKMKKLQQNRSRTCTANPNEYSLHRLHFPSSTGSAPSDPAHRPSAPFRHYKRRRSRSGPNGGIRRYKENFYKSGKRGNTELYYREVWVGIYVDVGSGIP